MAGNNDDLDKGIVSLDFFQGFNTIYTGHPDVQQHEIRRVALDDLERFIAVWRGHHIKALIAQKSFKGLHDRRFIVHN